MEELRQTLSAAEWAEWKAFWRIEPWGDVRSDMHNALLCRLIYSAHAGKRGRKVDVEDFMLSSVECGKADSAKDLLRIGQRMASSFGGEWRVNGALQSPSRALSA